MESTEKIEFGEAVKMLLRCVTSSFPDTRIPSHPEELLVGRNQENSPFIQDKNISRVHFAVS